MIWVGISGKCNLFLISFIIFNIVFILVGLLFMNNRLNNFVNLWWIVNVFVKLFCNVKWVIWLNLCGNVLLIIEIIFIVFKVIKGNVILLLFEIILKLVGLFLMILFIWVILFDVFLIVIIFLKLCVKCKVVLVVMFILVCFGIL